ncbi:MAG: DUF4867 family protein [Lachnospiraceae bacterium]|nr:DUF4867 family protein [Lachnospiraceae bacterium]
MEILSVLSPEFKAYGRIVDNVDFAPLLEELKKTPVPENVVYEPSVKALEETATFIQLTQITFGEMPIQIGFCNGHNSMLNALEYHKDSEVNVMATDAILLLGLRSELEKDFTYDTANVKAFLVPAGTAVEVYATSLHYAPCGVAGKGYQVAIVLPKGTNYPFTQKRDRNAGEDRLMTAVNKWVIGHPEGGLAEGSFLGLKGENLSVL